MRLCSKACETEFDYLWQNICDSDGVERALSARSVHKLFTIPFQFIYAKNKH